MNIFFYHKQNPSTDVNQDTFSYNKLYVDNMLANIKFVGNRFPNSKIFLIEEGLNTSSLNLPNLTVIKQIVDSPDGSGAAVAASLVSTQPTWQNEEQYPELGATIINQNKNLSARHRDFLKNYFHLYCDDEDEGLVMTFFERWFCLYEVLIVNNIQNFIYLDSDCVLLEETTSHNYEKIGINHPPHSEDCWPNAVMCSTINLNKFLDFMRSFYEEVQKQKNKEKYINSFFDKPRTSVCDMALWYLFKKQNPDLFINNLTIDPDGSIHDLGLGYGVNGPNEYHEFTSDVASKYDPQGNLEARQIKQIFYTEDGPCFEEKDTKKLIKIKSLHFSPGTLKFDIIPFIEECEKIYGTQ